MSNPNKAKGTKFESDVVRYLTSRGIQARRVVQTGRYDTGDIHAGNGWVLQAKAWTRVLDGINAGVQGYKPQRHNAGRPFGAAVVKRPQKNVRESFVVMDLEDYASLLIALGLTSDPGPLPQETPAAHYERHTQ